MSTVLESPEPAAGDGQRMFTTVREEHDSPGYLVPKMGRVTVNEPVYYRSLHFLEVLGQPTGEPEELTEAIDPFDDTRFPGDAKLQPGVGVLTVHEQTWRQKGLELGNLLQSVCLAPGEVTQVAVTRWEHETRGAGTEAAEQGEAVTSQAEQHRAVNEVQRAVANEAQWGTSSTSSSSSSAQAGAACLFGSASAATTSTSAMTAQHSGGSRNLAAESSNAIDQRTAETSQALRSRRQSVVREVSEQEAESLSTRVLANYNRRHTLNVLYFEVLQSYRVRTVLKEWDRCLFVPMIPLDFTQEGVIAAHQAQLLAIFRELGATEMIGHLHRALGHGEKLAQAKEYEEELKQLQKALELAQEYAEAEKRLEHARGDVVRFTDMRQNSMAENAGLRARQVEERLSALKVSWDELSGHPSELPPINTSVETRLKSMVDLEAKVAANRIPVGQIFNLDRVFLSQEIWLRMSPHRVHRILLRFRVPGDPEAAEEGAGGPLAALADPRPVGVYGTYLVFRWGFPKGEAGEAARMRFARQYLGPAEGANGESVHASTRDVGLPTSGIFAEAVLGEGLAAETINEQFPSWGDEANRIPILPPKIANLQSRDRAKGMDLRTGDFASSLAQLRAEQLAGASYIDGVLGQVGRGDMFRDMGGLAQAVTLAEKMGAMSAEGATKAGERATQLQAKVLETFEKVLDSQVGQAAVAEFMLPGSGAALLAGKDSPKEGTAAAKPEAGKA